MQDTFFNIDSIFPKRALFSAPAYSFVVGRTAEVADARVLSLSLWQTDSKMVFRLQERQLETHPVVNSIADILIDSLIELLGPYELYLKQ